MNNMEFKVLLVDQRKLTKRWLLAILLYLILYSAFVLSIFYLDISKGVLLASAIAMILLIVLFPYLLIRPVCYREMILLNENAISTLQFGAIGLDQISKIKSGGNSIVPSIRIQLENGFQLTIMSPYWTAFFSKDPTFDLYLAILRNSRQLGSPEKTVSK